MRVDGASPRTHLKYHGVMRFFTAFLRQRLGHAPWVHEVNHELVQDFKTHASGLLRHRNGARHGLGRPVSARTVTNELNVVRVLPGAHRCLHR